MEEKLRKTKDFERKEVWKTRLFLEAQLLEIQAFWMQQLEKTKLLEKKVMDNQEKNWKTKDFERKSLETP